MSGQPPNPELQEALFELQQYLSDALPPLTVIDSIQTLMKYPPQAVLPTIRAWTGAQYRGGASASVPVSDYLFHAVKKVHMMGEFKLIPREPLEAYLAGLTPLVLALCPEEDRAMLLENLGRMDEHAQGTGISPVQTIFRQSPGEGGARASTASAAARGATGPLAAAGSDAAGPSNEALRGLRRFELLLERLDARGDLGGGGAAAPAHPDANAALAFAAKSSQTAQELDRYLAQLKAMGLDAGTNNLFHALAQSLPGWIVPGADAAGAQPAVETRAIGAMRRIITEADDPVEASKRFQELVRTGIEKFNEGSLPQAVQMLELADRLVSEKKVDAGSAEIVRRKMGDSLDPEQLKKFAEAADQHAALRKVLRFFQPLSVEGLLEVLPGEPKRDRRRLLLLLLEVHGAPARAAAFERLGHTLGPAVGEEEWFFRRNLLYILRRVPRGADAAPSDVEADLLLQHSQLGLPLVVVKEAVAALGQLRDERTETGLAQIMADLETMLVKPTETAPYDSKDLRALLDRVAAAMARLPSSRARRALIDHAQKKNVQLGETSARVAELGSQNLSDDPDAVAALLELLRANMPFKLLGLKLRQSDQNLVHVIDALSGTPAPAVRKGLEEVAAKLRGQEGGRAAERALAAFDRPAAAPGAPETGGAPATAESPAASLQGDLEVFGLPALLQSLSDSSASGTLTLREQKSGAVFATLALREGKLLEIQRGRLRGENAFYQLLERPTPGQFAFVKGTPVVAPGAAPREILPLTLEAMRRYDEFQEAAALVPDGAALEATSVKPTPHPSEKDGGFLQALWARAGKGGTPLELEEAVETDSYRVRRMLVHWVEQGALKVR